jgi:hypothetical protein
MTDIPDKFKINGRSEFRFEYVNGEPNLKACCNKSISGYNIFVSGILSKEILKENAKYVSIGYKPGSYLFSYITENEDYYFVHLNSNSFYAVLNKKTGNAVYIFDRVKNNIKNNGQNLIGFSFVSNKYFRKDCDYYNEAYKNINAILKVKTDAPSVINISTLLVHASRKCDGLSNKYDELLCQIKYHYDYK